MYKQKVAPTVPDLVAKNSVRCPLRAFIVAATTSPKSLAPDIRAVGVGMENYLASLFGSAVLRGRIKTSAE